MKELLASGEPRPTMSAVRFEAGWHYTSHGSIIWNKTLTQRILRQKPDIVAIDGLAPSLNPTQPDHNFAPYLPFDLEEFPNDFFVLSGDIYVSDYRDIAPSVVSKQLARGIEKWQEDEVGQARRRQFSSYAGGLALATLSFRAANRVVQNDSTAETMSRRKVLGLLGKGVGGFVLSRLMGRIGIEAGSPFLADQNLYNRLGRFSRLVQPLLNDGDWWQDGRTALLISKTQDSLDIVGRRPDLTSSVVMGGAHFPLAQKIIDNAGFREKMIRQLLKKTARVVDILLDECSLAETKSKEVKKEIMTFMETMELTRFDKATHSFVASQRYISKRVAAVRQNALLDF